MPNGPSFPTHTDFAHLLHGDSSHFCHRDVILSNWLLIRPCLSCLTHEKKTLFFSRITKKTKKRYDLLYMKIKQHQPSSSFIYLLRLDGIERPPAFFYFVQVDNKTTTKKRKTRRPVQIISTGYTETHTPHCYRRTSIPRGKEKKKDGDNQR